MVRQTQYRYTQTLGFYTGVGRGRGFFNPVDMSISSEGILYVLNRGTERDVTEKRVTVCTLDEEFLGDFSTGGNESGQMIWPVGITLNLTDNVFISDEFLNRISIFDKEGNFVSHWGVQGNGYGQFEKPAGIVFDQEENLLVVDSGNNRVQRYTQEGRCLGQWGRGGRGDGEFNLPWGINVDHLGEVYVADWRNDRIQKFGPDGKHLATLGASGKGDGEFNRPTGVAVDKDLNVIIADWGNQRVQLLGPDGRFIAVYHGEGEVSKWAQEYLDANPVERDARLVSDMEPELDPEAIIPDYQSYRSGSIEKLFWGPMSVKIDNAGRVYILESLRHRIQIYCS